MTNFYIFTEYLSRLQSVDEEDVLIEHPYNGSVGYAISQRDAKTLLERAGLEITETQPSSEVGLMLATLKLVGESAEPERQGGISVSVHSWQGPLKEYFQQIAEGRLREFAKLHLEGLADELSVVLHMPENGVGEPRNKDFNIFFNALPWRTTQDVEPPSAVLGVPITHEQDAYRVTPAMRAVSLDVIDVEEGGESPVLLFDKFNLYIPFALNQGDDSGEWKERCCEAFQQILTDVVDSLDSCSFDEERFESPDSDLHLIVPHSDALNSIVATIDEAYADLGEVASNAKAELVNACGRLREAERVLHQFSDADEYIQERFSSQFRLIEELPEVDHATVQQGCVVVRTHEITVVRPDNGDEHLIGRLELWINPKPTADILDAIRISNLDRTQRGVGEYRGNTFATPHVKSDGKCCFAPETKMMLHREHEKLDFYILVMMLISFTQTVNLNDAWGRGITNWPKVS